MGWCTISRLALTAVILAGAVTASSAAQAASLQESDRLVVWAGSATGSPGSAPTNAVVVIDTNRSSPTYGRMIASVETDRPSTRAHHTEYVMPPSGVLFANDHDAGRSYRIDLRDPDKPELLGAFEGMG